ncbi:MAG: hypothetical protein LBM75_09245 [Myxococcales bacterium]|jgi:hypothetical protein|nr:hypothetical protein [Myxococcales bacterium]
MTTNYKKVMKQILAASYNEVELANGGIVFGITNIGGIRGHWVPTVNGTLIPDHEPCSKAAAAEWVARKITGEW